MKQSFLLSNIVPQNHQQNAGIWNELEIFCRELTLEWDAVHVITGHVMRPITDSIGNKVVSYQVIGANEVAVPTHLFKIILCQSGPQERNEHCRDIEKQKGDANLDLGKIFNPRAPPPNYPYRYTRFDGLYPDKLFQLRAFLIPNSEIAVDKRFQDYAISIKEIEKFSGIYFFGGWRVGKATKGPEC